MIETIRKIWTPSRRRRKLALDDVRRQFANCGYTLEDLTDSELERLITYGTGEIEKLHPLTAKKIYWTLRKISPDGSRFEKRKIKRAAFRHSPKPF